MRTVQYGGADCKSQIVSGTTAIRPVILLDILAFNKTGGTLYIMYFDNVTTAPANGTAPSAPWGIEFPVQTLLGGTLGRLVDISGGVICWSSTPNTLTLVGANSGPITAIVKA